MKAIAVKEKAGNCLYSAAAKATRIATGVSLMMAGVPVLSVFAAPTADGGGDDLKSWLNQDDNKVNIDTSNLSGTTIMSRFLQIISWITRLVGIFVVGKSVLDFLQAKQDENAVNESKAVRQAAIGIAMILAPTLLRVIFNGAG